MTSTPSTDGGSTRSGQTGRRAGLTARFLLAVGQEVGAEVLTPAALTRAVASVLPVDGAGLSTLMDALRIPLGSSGDAAAQAEELQTTLGEGPCLDAAERQAPVALDAVDLAARWPLFSAELTARTAYRAAASVPLRAPGGRVFAALDLYTTSSQLDASLDLTEVDQHLAPPAAALLSTCLDQLHDAEVFAARPEWYETTAGRRHNVWVAIGMVMATRPTRTRDALSLMRAHAYTQERSLDDLAADIVAGRLPATDLTD